MDSLPSEVLEEVFYKLEDAIAVVQCARVNTSWHKLICKNTVWEALCTAYFGNYIPQGDIKQYFAQRYLELCKCRRKSLRECGCAESTIELFKDLEISNELLRGITACEYEKLEPVQQRSLVPLMKCHDVFVHSKYGSGQTTSYCIAALHRMQVNGSIYESEEKEITREGREEKEKERNRQGEEEHEKREEESNEKKRKIEEKEVKGVRLPQVLVLNHNRELCWQGENFVQKLGQFLNFRSHSLVGGIPISTDMNYLKNIGADIIIASPGRILDLLDRKFLNTKHIHMFMLDEVDRSLDKGFLEQIIKIWKHLKKNGPHNIQVGLFTCSSSADIVKLVEKITINPIIINVIEPEHKFALDGTAHFYVNVEKEEYKFDTLLDLIDSVIAAQTVIFCNTSRRAKELEERMRERNYVVNVMSRQNTTEEREAARQDFNTKATRVLVLTDIAARAIEFRIQASVIISYDLPQSPDSYVHRVGRTAAHGSRGLAINFAVAEEIPYVRELETYCGTKIAELPANISDLLSVKFFSQGSGWMRTELDGSAWKCMEMYGTSWGEEQQGSAWKCIEMHGNVWKCMEHRGSRCNLVDIQDC